MKKLRVLEIICVVFLFFAATAIASPAQVLTTLHSFNGTDGSYPIPGLVQGSDGNFYGTTFEGGTNCNAGCGTIFKITPGGALTVYSSDGANGCGFYPGLVQATDGNFYGAGTWCGAYGGGTVFKMTPEGTLTTLYSFGSQPNDGGNPTGTLVQAPDGNFYGTTYNGGTNRGCNFGEGCGVVFRVTPSGTLTTLYNFCSQTHCADGSNPRAGLVRATDGNFYGTTYAGGANGAGTVFKITPSGTLTTLYSFCSKGGCADGRYPEAALVQATDGNFYGTTYDATADGVANGDGTVFKITPSGTLTTLYSFSGPDGANPWAGLVQATDGNLYGTTSGGGANGRGTVFKITPGGTLTTLHNFDGSDGGGPSASLVQASDGNFYGTTAGGGANGDGTVFRLVSVRPCFSCSLQWK